MTELPIGFRIKQICEKMLANADASLRRHGLTFSQMQVLEFLHFQGGLATQKEIEKYLGVSHPAVVGLVTRLAQAGFLECFMDESNKRNKIVCLTELAKEVEADTEIDRKAFDQKITEGMSQEEIREFHRLLSKVYDNLGCRPKEK